MSSQWSINRVVRIFLAKYYKIDLYQIHSSINLSRNKFPGYKFKKLEDIFKNLYLSLKETKFKMNNYYNSDLEIDPFNNNKKSYKRNHI